MSQFLAQFVYLVCPEKQKIADRTSIH